MANFSSKILLFGEYTILKGGVALAVPYNRYSGELILPNDDVILARKQLQSNTELKKLAIDLSQKEPFASHKNIYRFLEDTLLGLFFKSNIPENYGLGSSGAVVAAIYHRYFSDFNRNENFKPAQLTQIKSDLSAIESYYHGESSGIDPLVSFLDYPLLLNAPLNHLTFHIPDTLRVFLIDTKVESTTKNLIKIFTDRFQNPTGDLKKLITLNNTIVKSFLELNPNTLEQIQNFCALEQKLLPDMFVHAKPLFDIMHKHAHQVSFKLCGSGGGGYLLGFSSKENFTEIKATLEQHNFSTELLVHATQNMINLK